MIQNPAAVCASRDTIHHDVSGEGVWIEEALFRHHAVQKHSAQLQLGGTSFCSPNLGDGFSRCDGICSGVGQNSSDIVSTKIRAGQKSRSETASCMTHDGNYGINNYSQNTTNQPMIFIKYINIFEYQYPDNMLATSICQILPNSFKFYQHVHVLSRLSCKISFHVNPDSRCMAMPVGLNGWQFGISV